MFWTGLTDEGLKEVGSLKNLTSLGLGMTQVTDAGLKNLASLERLASLDLRRSGVTDEGVTELQKVLPRCLIDR